MVEELCRNLSPQADETLDLIDGFNLRSHTVLRYFLNIEFERLDCLRCRAGLAGDVRNYLESGCGDGLGLLGKCCQRGCMNHRILAALAPGRDRVRAWTFVDLPFSRLYVRQAPEPIREAMADVGGFVSGFARGAHRYP